MQHDKSTKKIEQIEKIAKSSNQITQSITDVIDKFKIKSNMISIDSVKRSGVLISTITTALLILPFLGAASVMALFKSGLNNVDAGQKDVYYDMKNNPKINWRSVLFIMAKQFQYLINQTNNKAGEIHEEVKRIKALIFDDSTLKKTGKKIEGIGFVHDHVTNLHVLGFKILVCGFWDGVSFIPVDFSLHREKRNSCLKKIESRLVKKEGQIKSIQDKITGIRNVRKAELKLQKQAAVNYKLKPNKTNSKRLEQKQLSIKRIDGRIKNIKSELIKQIENKQHIENQYFEIKSNHRSSGLTKKEINEQYKKQRDRNTAGCRRKKEAVDNKIDVMIKMLKRAISKGFAPDYVLTDSWFFSYKVLQAIISIGKNINLVSMARINNARFKILSLGQMLNPHEIITKYDRTRSKENRKYKARYMKFAAEYQGIRVNMFLIKFGRHGTWRMLVTTDLKLNINEIIEVYKIRWTIEVFFKECKQHLLLGKSQSLDFDAQIADTTLALIRYILLSYYERIHYGTSIGGLFKQLRQSAIEENILADINLYFSELLKIFSALAGIDFFTFYEELLRNDEAERIFSKIGINPGKNEILDAA